MNSSELFLYNPINENNSECNIWMAFPGPESFAMASLGYLWLFKKLDEKSGVNAERIYQDSISTKLSSENIDLIAFSFSFDTDFLAIFEMLKKYNIPLKAKERSDKFPLIFAGGPVITSNPTPYSQIFDFFVLGDGEDITGKIIEIYKEFKNDSKNRILQELSKLDGIYVPSIPKTVKKITKKISECIYTPILSDKSFFPNTFIIEIARGCANRCGFCIASYINLPFRFLPYDDIIKTIDLGLKHTNKLALLGAQLSAHPQFEQICDYIYEKIQNGAKIEMSVSSLRVDSITPNILKTLIACGQKNLTLAIEAGSERLRKVINKNLTKEQIFNATEIAKMAGLRGFKFYGMLGIPTETYDDINELINLAKELKQRYKGFDITFGFSTFVPKANTPFQWCGRESTKLLEKKAEYIKKEMHKIGVTATVSSPKWDYWQAVLSRGDESLCDYLIEVENLGGKLGAFKQAAKKLGIDTDYFACQNWDLEQKLPWDFIDIPPHKDFLIKENQRLLNIMTD